jgi:phospholipase/carboxylesterase
MHEYRILEKGKALAEAGSAIILLHGRGATAGNIIALADEFVDDTFYISAPQATNNTWYPFSFMAPESANEPWLTSAVETVRRLIDEVEKYLPSSKIYIMGFSQGACLSLEFAARHARKYAGVAAFTGGLIGETINPGKYNGDFEGTKIFIGNSDTDPHVPQSRTVESATMLKFLGADVRYRIYPGMAHTIIPDEIKTVKALMFPDLKLK